MSPTARRTKALASAEPPAPRLRSGAVARMLHMPVATLRVWERRYALTATALSPGGQRLYSADDVRRLALLKQLTDLGHAIGSLVSLDAAQLQQVLATHAQALAATQARPWVRRAPAPRAWRLVVVGQALGTRLLRPALLRQLGRPVDLLGPFADVGQAAAALGDGRPVDAWLLHEPQLHAGWLAAFQAAVPPSAPVAVLYGYAAAAVCDALAAGGVTLLREPQPDVALAQWLRLWADACTASGPPESAALAEGPGIAPRRWDDAALAAFGSLPSTVACECPRHVADLLLQLSRFEAYSAQCQQRSPADAALHALLERVAAEARASLEGALEQVAQHAGLPVPPAVA
ncbi:MAG TPA: MerR family transcriptional regulator [Burkholderiaceae bacterium]|nr:MerR family transcriptional regulator [Burkholderiaceae bacterium]